ncbi:MAG: glycoside hydrolase family 127 protein [Sedimentisphaerales bacterium]|nr:glycoside hydrolase family 127 protein [Sedimentisphaerales bacterium]
MAAQDYTAPAWLLCLALVTAGLAGAPRAMGASQDPGAGRLTVTDAAKNACRPFRLTQVELHSGLLEQRSELGEAYLLMLEPDRLLAWFRKEAGLEPKGEVYGGWESQGVAGHCLGHYLSALSLAWATTGDPQFRQRADYIVSELALCQQANGDGYVAAIPEGKRIFTEIARGEIRSAGFDLNGGWVPWYTMHKVMAGLRDAWYWCGNDQARTVLVQLSDWVHETTKGLDDAQWQKMLACEHGGMNEVLADVYAITGNQRHLDLARKFYHRAVLDPLAQGRSPLPGLHANTQVPKIIGCARLYELTGEEKYRQIAELFWDRVVHHHSYVNGGNSAWEHFGRPDELAQRLGDTTETCNTYNMLKLTRRLFLWQPRGELMDFYERALLNHIVASQNPVTGMTKYKGYLDMPAQKHFCTPFDSFWCCTGTGMENHVKYNETVYFHNGSTLWVNLFVPTKLDWKEQSVTVQQQTGFPYEQATRLTFSCREPRKLAIQVRRPAWAGEGFAIKVNGTPWRTDAQPGTYAQIEREFHNGDTITVQLPMTLRMEAMPDDANRVAMLYGPVLLCSELGSEREAPVLVVDKKELLSVWKPLDGPRPMFAAAAIGRVADDKGTHPVDVRLVPHFEVYNGWYSVYHDVFTPEQWEQKQVEHERMLQEQRDLEARTMDVLRIGEMQPERDHNFEGERTTAGEHAGRKWRHATDGGWFAFDMAVDPDGPNELVCTYWGSDAGGRVFDILVDGRRVATQELDRPKPDQFVDMSYAIPTELTQGRQKVRVRFQAHPGQIAGGLYGCRIVKPRTD